jgi:UV DNA damage endonuclease
MKIGYPVTNLGLGCITSHTFRLAALSEERLFATVEENLDCLEQTLQWNVAHNLLFYRISSGLIPFASHPSMVYDWQGRFAEQLARIGTYIRDHDFRISMHPGQYVVINSPHQTTFENSVRELQYHSELLDLMGLDETHKVQIHLGGLHGNPAESTQTFIDRYKELPAAVRQRLVIENDERIASLQDCLKINAATSIPVLFDTLHHQVNNAGETVLKGVKLAMATWQEKDGLPMIDYSTQNPDKKTGAHAITLDTDKFRAFAKSLKALDIDIMFEIKNKEASVLQAQIILQTLSQAHT